MLYKIQYIQTVKMIFSCIKKEQNKILFFILLVKAKIWQF